MEDQVLSQQNIELIEKADLAITSPAYSMQEKLMAIEFLEHIPSEQAVAILIRTAEMFSWSLSEDMDIKEVDEDFPSMTMSGIYHVAREERAKREEDSHTILESSAVRMIKMTERAAKALSNNPHHKGLTFLQESLKDLKITPEVRYICALGLGGNTSRGAFLALAQGLKDPHEEVRDRSVLSLKESLNALRGAGLHRSEVIAAFESATELAYCVDKPGELFFDKSSMFARFLLKQLKTLEVEHAHIAIVSKLKTDKQIELVFEYITSLQLSLESIQRLAKIVVMPGLPPNTYRAIAKILKSKKDEKIIEITRAVKKEKASLSARLLNFLLRRPPDAQEEAVNEILKDQS